MIQEASEGGLLATLSRQPSINTVEGEERRRADHQGDGKIIYDPRPIANQTDKQTCQPGPQQSHPVGRPQSREWKSPEKHDRHRQSEYGIGSDCLHRLGEAETTDLGHQHQTGSADHQG